MPHAGTSGTLLFHARPTRLSALLIALARASARFVVSDRRLSRDHRARASQITRPSASSSTTSPRTARLSSSAHGSRRRRRGTSRSGWAARSRSSLTSYSYSSRVAVVADTANVRSGLRSPSRGEALGGCAKASKAHSSRPRPAPASKSGRRALPTGGVVVAALQAAVELALSSRSSIRRVRLALCSTRSAPAPRLATIRKRSRRSTTSSTSGSS
jgi:hypothetical protein